MRKRHWTICTSNCRIRTRH